MPFTVGQYLTANDLKSQEEAHTLGYGVVNGLKVIPTGPPDMDVHVEIGKAYVADTLVEKGAVTDLTVTAADPTNPRKDIVVCNSAGTLSIVAGTPEAALPSGNVGVYTLEPEPPSIPANSIILGEIWVPAGATSISGSEIYDKRVPIADFLTHKGDANAHHAQSHTLASHSTKAHAELTGVTASQHHTKYTNAQALAAAIAGDCGRLTIAQTQAFSGSTPTSWTDLSLAGVVGSQATLALLKVYAGSATPFITHAIFRRNGDTDEHWSPNSRGVNVIYFSARIWISVLVHTDTSGRVEWKTDSSRAGVTVDVVAYIK